MGFGKSSEGRTWLPFKKLVLRFHRGSFRSSGSGFAQHTLSRCFGLQEQPLGIDQQNQDEALLLPQAQIRYAKGLCCSTSTVGLLLSPKLVFPVIEFILHLQPA